MMNRKNCIGLIFVLCFSWSQFDALSAQTANLSQTQISREIKSLGPFQCGEKSFFMIKEIAYLENYDETTIEKFRIIDENGDIHFQESYEISFHEYGFQTTYEIEPFIIETSSNQVLVVDYYILPSAPLSGHSRQLFVLENNKLVPFTKPLVVYGEFGELIEGKSENSYRLHENDIMFINDWTGYFFVSIPLQLDFNPKIDANKSPLKSMAAIDEKSGLEKFFTSVNPFLIDADYDITLFREPSGDFAEKIRVNPESKIEFGAAYGKVEIQDNEKVTIISSRIFRLEVVIDGKKGFVEESDFQHLGLFMAG